MKECARHSGLKSRSANNAGSMRFGTAVQDRGRRLDQREFRPMAEVAFRRIRQLSEYKGKGASASRETPTKPRSDIDGKQRPRPIHVAFLRYSDKMKVFSNAAARLKDNPFGEKLIGISEDFGKKTQDERKAIAPVRKYLQKKLGAGSKVFIAYPAILKCVDSNGRAKVISEKEQKRLKEEMEKDKESTHK